MDFGAPAKQPEGRYASLPVDMQVLGRKAPTQDQVPKPYLQPLLPSCYLPAASGAVHTDSTAGAGSWKRWLRHRTLSRCLCPKCVWAGLQANQVHAVHTLRKLGEPPELNSPVVCWTHSWVQFSAWSLHSRGHSPVVLGNVLLLKPENYRMWYMAVSAGFYGFASKMSCNFTSLIAILVQVPILGSAVLSKQTSAPSMHSLVSSQILPTVPELPLDLFNHVVFHFPRH